MKKSILVAIAVLAGTALFAQQKNPPPPPKVNLEKFVPPPPPPPPQPPAKKAVSLPEDYKAFLKRNPTVKALGWSENKVRVLLKSGQKEEYDLNNKAEMQSVKNKYGDLPAAPPKVIKE